MEGDRKLNKLIYLAFLLFFIQGCHNQSTHEQAQPPAVEFGKVCHIDSCVDCDKPARSCPLSNQEIVGAFCSCTTTNGIQYGSVTP